jgi:hypothetical protein
VQVLEKYFEDLESRIDEDVEKDLMQQWMDFADGTFSGKVFSPQRKKISAPGLEWPHIMVNDTLDDVDKMVLQQYAICSNAMATGKGELLSVRCNYGTGIIPSLFGAKLFVMPYEFDTLPGTKNLQEGKEDIRKLISQGVPDFRQGLGGKVFEAAKRFLEIGRIYPKIGKHVHVYAPDTQGPMAICQSLWGSNLYLDFYDEAALAHQMLNLATQTFIEFTKEWYKLVPPIKEGYCINWGLFHKGQVLIRDDDAMNLSPEMFEEFIKPYDQKILDKFGGGVIHFCGRGDHYIPILHQMKGVFAINMSQPECNNMDIIYENTINHGIKIIGLKQEEVERALAEGIDLRGCVHAGVSIAAWEDEKD